jgi:hypothetical protein
MSSGGGRDWDLNERKSVALWICVIVEICFSSSEGMILVLISV